MSYISPEQFDLYGDIARRKGFAHVASGPLVRSSYHAADFHPVIRTSTVAGVAGPGSDVFPLTMEPRPRIRPAA